MPEQKNPDQHQVIARRVLAPTQTAVLLASGNLSLADGKRGVQMTLDADAVYDLLDMLYQHRDELHRLTHHGQEEQR